MWTAEKVNRNCWKLHEEDIHHVYHDTNEKSVTSPSDAQDGDSLRTLVNAAMNLPVP